MRTPLSDSGGNEGLVAPARLSSQRADGGSRAHRRVLLPTLAAAAAFIGAFVIGVATKPGSTPQTATSLAPPVSIQAPAASVPALQQDVATPALRPRNRPAPAHHKPPARVSPAPVQPTASAPPSASNVIRSSSPAVVHNPPPAVVHNPPPAVVHSPPAGIVHSQSGSVVHSSSGGGGGVVHGGN